MSSLLIRGALVIDGSNREPFRGDIAVENGMITDVSPSIDLVLFDPLTIQDRSTFDHPHQYAAGVVYTWVNGCPTVQGGIVTGNTPGRVLRKRGVLSYS